MRRDRASRTKTRDELYSLYCTFGEKKHPGQDFLSKIANILRDSTEGLLTHAEVNHSKISKISFGFILNSSIIKTKVHVL
jgi:hypothetical protein